LGFRHHYQFAQSQLAGRTKALDQIVVDGNCLLAAAERAEPDPLWKSAPATGSRSGSSLAAPKRATRSPVAICEDGQSSPPPLEGRGAVGADPQPPQRFFADLHGRGRVRASSNAPARSKVIVRARWMVDRILAGTRRPTVQAYELRASNLGRSSCSTLAELMSGRTSRKDLTWVVPQV
jgi:hypothetical protein